MIVEDLKDFLNSFAKMKSTLKSFNYEQESVSTEVVAMLKTLVVHRIEHMAAFELLLVFAPDEALSVMKERYISRDLSNHINDQVADLEIMFDDIYCILGKEKFEELLNCPEFLAENKNNVRVKEAIEFAYDTQI